MFRNLKFWEESAERAIKSAAQFALLVILGTGMAGVADETVNAFTVSWMPVLGAFIGGAVISVLTSVISYSIGDKGTPSLVKQ